MLKTIGSKKKYMIGALALILAAVIIAGILSEYGSVSAVALSDYEQYKASFQSSDETGWTRVDTENQTPVVLENNQFKLEMNPSSTRFTVTEKASGTVYESFPETPPKLMSEEDIARANSNIALSYYNAESRIYHMGSGKDSVEKKQYEICTKDNRIRILYTIGSAVSDLFTPVVISKQDMEEIVFSSMKAFERSKLKLYYKLYSDSERPSDYNEMMELYPSLKDKEVYILTTEIAEQGLNEVSRLLKKSDFTKEQAEKGMKAFGVSDAGTARPAGFLIILELSLKSDGFDAEILTDRISENNQSDKLTDIYLLEYFGAKDESAKGYMLVPDGSGAKIQMNQHQPVNYLQHFYNDDLLIRVREERQLSRNVPVPYFGMVCDTGAFIAYVESGAGVGSVYARTMGGANPMNMIGTKFAVRAVDQTDIGKDRNIPTLNIYNGHIVYEHPKVSYKLLPYSDTVLGDMAFAVRRKMGIQPSVSKSSDVPLYLDFLCLSSYDSNILGVTLHTPVVMSRISEIIEVVEKLHENGVKNLRVRLKGWTEEGLKHAAFDSAQLSRKVGTFEQLNELRELLNSNGGQLYLDTDFSFSQKNSMFDSLALSRDGSQNLEGAVASLKEFDRVTLQQIPMFREGYIISPLSYAVFADNFLSDYKERLGKFALSWSRGGSHLTANYDSEIDVDMAYTTKVTANIFQKLQTASHKALMTDYGYEYTLPYVSDIVNLPMTSSYFIAETGSVTFLQMILSGVRDYSGPALNMTGTRSKAPQMAASASAPYYIFMTAEDETLKELELQNTYYSLNYRAHIEKMIAFYHQYNKEMKSLYGCEIVDYIQLDNDVSKTVFQDNSELYVNYSNRVKTAEGMELQPFSYRKK